MARHTYSLSRQIGALSLIFAFVLVTALGSFEWWATSSIDDRLITRQIRSVQRGLRDITERIPFEQDILAVSDDAVTQLREENNVWIADNLGESLSEYFRHDRIYIVDAADVPIRAVQDGQLVDRASFYTDASTVISLVADLRKRMAERSQGMSDSTSGVKGLSSRDFIVLPDGEVAFVSVRPIIPGSDAVVQAPGTEYLHISLRIIDDRVASEIADRYEVPGLSFQRRTVMNDDVITSPLINEKGRIVGFFTWVPEEPAYELMLRVLPFILGCLVAGGAIVFVLLRRLQRTSACLEQAEAKASFLAGHDPMTRLANRALFEETLAQAVMNLRDDAKVALHYVDLDHFKQVNDTLGHAAGDDLLRQAAARLCSLVGSRDTVARLGGDEFAIIQIDAAHASAEHHLSQSVVDCFAVPFNLSGHQVHVGASVGVTLATDANWPPEDIMHCADIALYEAKKTGKGRYRCFDGKLNAAIKERRLLEVELQSALNGQPGLILFYQPIFHSMSRVIVGAEALVRWKHPRHGLLLPASFVELAEERKLVDQLGAWVLNSACRYAALSGLPWVAVNVSPQQFQNERFADQVLEILRVNHLHPRRLQLEITEGLLLQNSTVTQATLLRLRASGIRVALDDFGTGYSSISYLRSHALDKLKIDRAYISQLGCSGEAKSIVKSIVDLARALNMEVTAEGVETEEHLTALCEMGCNQLQGSLLSMPLEANELDQLLLHSSLPNRIAPCCYWTAYTDDLASTASTSVTSGRFGSAA
jgi:diguanylate cyclase (GGDEF)-like protein